MQITEGQLVPLARTAIEFHLTRGKEIDAALFFNGVIPESLKLTRGVFVTLTQDHEELRGCKGILQSSSPLYLTVPGTAVDAATDDDRFPPLERHELDNINIEVDILSAPELLKPSDRDEISEQIVIGMHGLVLVIDRNLACFLPQVPVDRGWDVKDYLSNLCIKAGLARETWLEPKAKLFRFTTRRYLD
jgi:AmmeMemoRadiSam system protein A